MNATIDTIKREAVDKAVREIIKNVKNVHGGIRGIFNMAPRVVEQVQIIAGNLSGENKMDIAIDVLFSIVKLPWWLPKMVAKTLATWAIELSISEVKKRLTKEKK